jgi:hypothetical protein
MKVITIELIDPGAKALLQDLVNRNLIRIRETDTPSHGFSALVSKLRSRSEEVPDLEEIADEVALVRAVRKKANG